MCLDPEKASRTFVTGIQTKDRPTKGFPTLGLSTLTSCTGIRVCDPRTNAPSKHRENRPRAVV